jgi:hypothetical protein
LKFSPTTYEGGDGCDDQTSQEKEEEEDKLVVEGDAVEVIVRSTNPAEWKVINKVLGCAELSREIASYL